MNGNIIMKEVIIVCFLSLSQVHGLVITSRNDATKNGTRLDYNRTTSLPQSTGFVAPQIIAEMSSDDKKIKQSRKASRSSFEEKVKGQNQEFPDECEWKSNAIICFNNTLNLESVGCTSDGDTIKLTSVPRHKHEKNFQQTSQSSDCSGREPQTISCKVCQTWDTWSNWTKCCYQEVCDFDFIGSISKFQTARYRNISMECQKAFSSDNTCFIDTEKKRCVPRGRAVNPNPDPNEGQDEHSQETSSGIMSSTTKTIVFCVAGVAMVGLFGFAGTRLLRTMYVRPSTAERRSSRLSRISQSQQNNQYANDSFRRNGYDNREETNFLMTDCSRGKQRMPPTISRLSIIPEEEDTHSTSMQDPGNASVNQSPFKTSQSGPESETDGDVNASIDFMDDVINQIEEAECESTAANCNHRNSILDTFGWNPEARSSDLDNFQVERLKDNNNTECLAASDLSLASANLLRAALPGDTSSVKTSSSSLSEESYSLKDISDSDTKNTNLNREFMSLPDISRMTDCIPDVEEMLSDSDISNSSDDNLVC